MLNFFIDCSVKLILFKVIRPLPYEDIKIKMLTSGIFVLGVFVY